MPHNELLFKLHKLKQPIWLIKLLSNYFSGRTFHVKIKNKISSSKRIAAGTAQGAIISPSLYNLYISDMPTNPDVYQYADDTAFLFAAKTTGKATEQANLHMERLSKWCDNWKTKINATKSQALCFQQTQRPTTAIVKYKGDVIPRTTNLKYLGVIIDKDLKFNEHTANIVEKIEAQTRSLFRWIKFRKLTTIQTKEILYKSLIIPTINYGQPAWDQATKTNHETLQLKEKEWIRIIYGLSLIHI